MNKSLKAEIEYINILFTLFLFSVLALLFFKISISNVYNGVIDLKTLVLFILGSLLLLTLIFLLLTIEKKFYFKEKSIRISLLTKSIDVKYSDIEYLKFVSPPRSNTFISLQLKKRLAGKKSFAISVNANKINDLLEILNYSRSQEVQTGINSFGEKYFHFSKTKNQYMHRKDVKIDLKNLW